MPPAEPAPLPAPLLVPTPRGDARVHVDRPAGRGRVRAVLAFGHGAGGGITAPDLVAVTRAAVGAGYAVARVEQPYRVAGRRAPAPAPALDEAWTAVLAALPGVLALPARRRPPLVVGGRSSGARVACRTAAAVGAAAVVALAFPVRPPQRPDADRLAELALPPVPVLVVQGDRDPFGMPPAAPGRTVLVVPGADHALRRDLAGVSAAVLSWLAEHLPAPYGR